MWELVAEWRELKFLKLKVLVGAGGYVKGAGMLEAWSLCGSWRLSEGSWSAWGLKFMWEVLAVWRELKYLRPMFIWEVVAEQWRCWVWGLKFMWELMGVWRELAAMWLKVCGGAGGYVQGAGGYVNKPKIGYSSGLNWTFLTFTWPAPDLDPDLSLTILQKVNKYFYPKMLEIKRLKVGYLYHNKILHLNSTINCHLKLSLRHIFISWKFWKTGPTGQSIEYRVYFLKYCI